ncbi:MAG: site-2 protease family protein [Pseudonocardia sp.]
MRATFHLGRIAGVRVGVHWSVLVIFAIVAAGLAGGRFPAAYPEAGAAAHLIAGLAAAVVFFGSLLAHEISHAVVARRHGVPADSIVLWLLGGVARLSGEAPDPRAELRIAGVGPLVSLLLGGAFLAGASVLSALGYQGLTLAAVMWLGGINIVLAVFNSVPAAPLDGGRLLRALIWWRTGDRLRATVLAGRAGQVFGWVLVALGLLTLFTGAGLGGLWLAFVGWFLIAAAAAEGRQAALRDQLRGVRVREVMTPDPVTLLSTMTVGELMDSAHIRHRHSTFPLVGDRGTPEGLATFTQIRRVDPSQRAATPLGRIGCPPDQIAHAGPDEPIGDLLPRMTECAEGRALVVADGTLVGIVSPSDLNRFLRWTGVQPVAGGRG